MAYNPFNIFRRNQKAIFAVLTVFIMFMFVLSSGLGGGADFFDWFPRWIGNRGGDKVCKIDGSDVTTKDLEKIRFKRVMANRFMELSARYTELAIQDYLNQQQGRLGGQGQAVVNAALQTLAMLERPQFAALIIQQLPALIEEMNQVIESPNAKEDDKAVARAVQALFRLIYQQRLGGDHYFANAPNKTNRDLIEFMLWEKKADAMGIEFSEDDVKKLVQSEFFGFLGARDVQVRARLREEMQGFSDDACLKALAVEFKVRAAQKALFGYGGLGAPAFVTPWELFDYYRDQCSPATYEVISVPSSAFVEKVTAEPTEAELKDLYNKYKDDEPRPNKDTPGFKRPRKVAVAWISATGEEPYYKKLAAEHLRVGEVMAKSSGMLTVPVPGIGGAWFGGAGPLLAREPAVNTEYEYEVFKFKNQLKTQYYDATVLPWNLLDTSTVRPGVMTSAVGAMGAQFPIGNPATAASLMIGAAIGYEIRDRVNVGMPLVLGLIPGPSMLPTIVGGSAASNLVEPKPLPIEAMKPELIKTVLDRKAKELMREDLAKFIQELHKPNQILEASLAIAITDPVKYFAEVRKLSDPTKPKTPEQVAALDKYIKDFVTTRGIQMGSSSPAPGAPPGSPPVLRDEWTLEEDPGLQPLVIAQKESLKQAKSFHGGEYIPFGRKFFWAESFTMQGRQRVPTTGLYVAQFYPEERLTPPDPFSAGGSTKPQYVVWRTADQPAAPTDFIAARDSVRAAWKKLKARELAQAKANTIAQTIQTSSTAPALLPQLLNDEVFRLRDQVSDPKARDRVRKFVLKDVAPLAPAERFSDMSNPFGPSRPQLGGVQPFILPESEDIPFPTKDMEKALLDNRDKPPKTVFVLPDAGQDTFYIVTLLRRDMKDAEDFKNNVYSQFGGARRAVTQMFLFETMRKSRLTLLELLKKEFKYEETEEQKKKLDENAKSGGRD